MAAHNFVGGWMDSILLLPLPAAQILQLTRDGARMPRTFSTSPSASGRWKRRFRSSVWNSLGELKPAALHGNCEDWERSLKSETNQERPQEAQAGPRRRSSKAFSPSALSRPQLNGVPRRTPVGIHHN